MVVVVVVVAGSGSSGGIRHTTPSASTPLLAHKQFDEPNEPLDQLSSYRRPEGYEHHTQPLYCIYIKYGEDVRSWRR